MTNKFTIAFTRREAELYRSHGLLEEAHDLYRQVLDISTTLGPSLAAPLQEKIVQLENELTELAELETDISDVVTNRELSILRESWGDAHSPADIGICASALCSIGLYEAAIEEYCKLVRLNQPQADYVDGLTDCIVAVYAPEAIGDAVEALIALHQPPEAHPTALRIRIAAALTHRWLDQPALTLFHSARSIRPLPDRVEFFVKEIQKRLDRGATSIDSRLSTPVKEKGAARQLKSYLSRHLARLQSLLHRLRKV
jgi:tetratricopeptide (TPR) repeat protein